MSDNPEIPEHLAKFLRDMQLGGNGKWCLVEGTDPETGEEIMMICEQIVKPQEMLLRPVARLLTESEISRIRPAQHVSGLEYQGTANRTEEEVYGNQEEKEEASSRRGSGGGKDSGWFSSEFTTD